MPSSESQVVPGFVIPFGRFRHDLGAVYVELEGGGFQGDVVWQNALGIDDEPDVFPRSECRHIDVSLSADGGAADLAYGKKQPACTRGSVACVYNIDPKRFVIGGWEEELLDTQVRLRRGFLLLPGFIFVRRSGRVVDRWITGAWISRGWASGALLANAGAVTTASSRVAKISFVRYMFLLLSTSETLFGFYLVKRSGSLETCTQVKNFLT